MAFVSFQIDGQDTVVERPTICPHCHVATQPELLAHFLHKRSEEGKQERLIVWRCMYDDCGKTIVSIYDQVADILAIDRILDGSPLVPEWPDAIRSLQFSAGKAGEHLDTRFLAAYSQSLLAEQHGLSEIAGIGYRKAIEYLVKDFVRYHHPEESDSIQKMWLGQVIDKYYDGELQEILKRATWLGNDQAHASRLFEDFHIGDLKELIGLIAVELDRRARKEHYIKNIQNRKV